MSRAPIAGVVGCIVAAVVGLGCSKAEPVGEAEKPTDKPDKPKGDVPTTSGNPDDKPKLDKSGLDEKRPGDPARDKLVAAWKQAKLDVEPFARADSPIGSDCAMTAVAKLDVQVCVFASAAEAKAAEAKGLDWVGPTTGTAQAKGATLIVVADRDKADPHGKTINQIVKLAP